MAEQIRSRYPNVSVSVESGPRTGDSYLVAVSCVLPERDREVSDLLELEIIFDGLHSKPVISSVDVVWGHPSGYLETELLEHPRRLDEAGWADLMGALPRLQTALEAGLLRGHPPEESA